MTVGTASTRWLVHALLLLQLLLLLIMVQTIDGFNCAACIGGEIPSDDEDCQELITETTAFLAGTRECRTRQLENFQEGCCETAPRGVCTLCPDGSPFAASTVVPSFDPDDGDRTCADLNVDQSYLDYIFESGKCEDTLLQRSAGWCGCPNVERECSLCPDGSKPPNPTLIDPVYYGWNCAAFDFVSSYFRKDECPNLVNEIYEFDAPSYCGCPNSPIPDVCNFCPDGQELVNPDILLGSGSFSCRELALSTRYIPVISTCVDVLARYQSKGYMEECCGSPFQTTTSATKKKHNKTSTLMLMLPILSLLLLQSWS